MKKNTKHKNSYISKTTEREGERESQDREIASFYQMANLPSVSADKTEPHIDLTDSDMAAAAEQLMQLSGDEDYGSKNNDGQTNMQHKRKGMHTGNAAQSKDQSCHGTGECLRPKKRRYRSIVHLYMTTKPVNVVYGKEVKSRRKTN